MVKQSFLYDTQKECLVYAKRHLLQHFMCPKKLTYVSHILIWKNALFISCMLYFDS